MHVVFHLLDVLGADSGVEVDEDLLKMGVARGECVIAGDEVVKKAASSPADSEMNNEAHGEPILGHRASRNKMSDRGNLKVVGSVRLDVGVAIADGEDEKVVEVVGGEVFS